MSSAETALPKEYLICDSGVGMTKRRRTGQNGSGVKKKKNRGDAEVEGVRESLTPPLGGTKPRVLKKDRTIELKGWESQETYPCEGPFHDSTGLALSGLSLNYSALGSGKVAQGKA